MDPAHLLEAPLVSNPVFSKMMGEATTRGIVWGHTVEYKSCSLDTLPDNKKPVLRSAPWPATKRLGFKPSDTNKLNAKHEGKPELNMRGEKCKTGEVQDR